MKRLLLLLLCATLLFGCTPKNKQDGNSIGVSADADCSELMGVKAIWLSQYDMFEVYTDGAHQRGVEDYLSRMERVLDNIVACGFNTVFLQVRPFGDSLCRSKIYPASYILTGDYGIGASYDAVDMLLSAARERGLSVHAWINPLRTMGDGDFYKIADGYIIKKWYDDAEKRGKYIVRVGERWYLNPAYGEVRELIVSGAREILELYAFDGVHIDDYFYPTYEESFDAEAYADYISSGGELSIGDFRREAINLLVSGLYDAAHERGRIFGVAPSGVSESAYTYQFADVYLWCAEEGYVDYICPQVYFGFLHETCPFDVLCDEWSRYVRGSEVALIIGITAHKAYLGYDEDAGAGREEWTDHKDVLSRCVECARTLRGCVGVSVFSYQYLYDPVSGEEIAQTSKEREALAAVLASG